MILTMMCDTQYNAFEVIPMPELDTMEDEVLVTIADSIKGAIADLKAAK